MSQLIALVATAVIIAGERTIIQPGQPLPELSNHDSRELVQAGAAQDPAQLAHEEGNAEFEARMAERDVAQSRRLIEDENEARQKAEQEAKELEEAAAKVEADAKAAAEAKAREKAEKAAAKAAAKQ